MAIHILLPALSVSLSPSLASLPVLLTASFVSLPSISGGPWLSFAFDNWSEFPVITPLKPCIALLCWVTYTLTMSDDA